MGPVERAIRASIAPGKILATPAAGANFVVERVDKAGVVLLLGKGRWWTRLGWELPRGDRSLPRQPRLGTDRRKVRHRCRSRHAGCAPEDVCQARDRCVGGSGARTSGRPRDRPLPAGAGENQNGNE